MITIIHPSRGRPSEAYKTGLKWIERIGLPDDQFEYILSLDSDDRELWSYKKKMPCLNFTRFIGENRSAIDAINFPAEFYSAYRGLENNSKDFLIVISDDFDCPNDWGKLLANFYLPSDWILKTFDGVQDWIITLPIMDWVYYKRFNYIYHPSYKHAFCDTEMTYVGDLLGRKMVYSLQFTHRPNGQIIDETSIKSDATFEEGKRNFIDRRNRNFDLSDNQIKGVKPNNWYSRMQ